MNRVPFFILLFLNLQTFALPNLDIYRPIPIQNYYTWERSRVSTVENCVGLTIQLPVRKFDRKVVIRRYGLYLPISSSPVPLVIHIPTINGMTPLESHLGKSFCKAGFAFLIAMDLGTEFPNPSLGAKEVGYQVIDAVRGISGVLNRLNQNPQPGMETIPHYRVSTPVMTNKVGVTALSNGTIAAAVLAAVDKRIHSLFLVGAVGDLSKTMAYSVQTKVRNYRESYRQIYSLISVEGFRAHMTRNGLVDPIDYLPLVHNKRIHQVIIPDDTVVPVEAQWTMHHLLKSRNQYSFEEGVLTSHSNEIIRQVYVKTKNIVSFFKDQTM